LRTFSKKAKTVTYRARAGRLLKVEKEEWPLRMARKIDLIRDLKRYSSQEGITNRPI
jgi:hypothetical protein